MQDVYFKATKETKKARKSKIKKLKEKHKKVVQRTQTTRPVDPIQIQTIQNIKALAKLPESQTSGGAITSQHPHLKKLAEKYTRLHEARYVPRVVDPIEAQRIQALRSVAEIPMKGEYPSGISYQYFLEEEKKKKAKEAEEKSKEAIEKTGRPMQEVMSDFLDKLYKSGELGFNKPVEDQQGLKYEPEFLNALLKYDEHPGYKEDYNQMKKKLEDLEKGIVKPHGGLTSLGKTYMKWEHENYPNDSVFLLKKGGRKIRVGADQYEDPQMPSRSETDEQYEFRFYDTMKRMNEFMESRGLDPKIMKEQEKAKLVELAQNPTKKEITQLKKSLRHEIKKLQRGGGNQDVVQQLQRIVQQLDQGRQDQINILGAFLQGQQQQQAQAQALGDIGNIATQSLQPKTGKGLNFDDMHPTLLGGFLGHEIIHSHPKFKHLRHNANKVLLNLAHTHGKPVYKDLVSKMISTGKTMSNIHPAIHEGFKNILSKIHGGSFLDNLKDKFTDFMLKYNPISVMLRHSINKGLEQRKQKYGH